MDFQGDPDIPGLRRKGRRALRCAVAASFLLAFFWSVSDFLVWLFLGAAVYCYFLSWFYNFQTSPRVTLSYEQQRSEMNPDTASSPFAKRLSVFLFVFFAITAVAVFFKISMSTSTSDSDENPEEIREDEQAQQHTPNSGQILDSLTDRGNNMYNNGKFDSAIVFYNRVLKLDPDNQSALYDKALAHYGKNEFNLAIPILQKCLSLHPEYGEALWLLGDVYYNWSKLDSAKVYFDRAFGVGLRNGTFLQLMAGLYEPLEKSRAIELYRESIHQDSTLVESYKKLAELEPSGAADYQRRMKKWAKSEN